MDVGRLFFLRWDVPSETEGLEGPVWVSLSVSVAVGEACNIQSQLSVS